MPKRKLTSISNEAASNKRQATGDGTVTEGTDAASTPSEMDPHSNIRQLARCLPSLEVNLIFDSQVIWAMTPEAERNSDTTKYAAQILYRGAVLDLLPLAGKAMSLLDKIRQSSHAIHKACLTRQIIMERTENELVGRRFLEQSLGSPRSLVSSVSSSIGELCDDSKRSLDTVTEVKDDIARILEEKDATAQILDGKDEENNDLLELQELLSVFFKTIEMLARRADRYDADMDALTLKYSVNLEKLDPEGKLAGIQEIGSKMDDL
jgi:hypothetical protein